MTLILEDIEPLVEKELEKEPEVSRDVIQRVAEVLRRVLLRAVEAHPSATDVVLEDASGRVILLEAKMGSGKTAAMVSEILQGKTEAAVLAGSSANALVRAMRD